MGGDPDIYIPLIQGIQKAIRHQSDKITNVAERTSRIEAKLNNGMSSDIKELKTSREKDKIEAIEAREREWEKFREFVKDLISPISSELKTHIQQDADVKKEKARNTVALIVGISGAVLGSGGLVTAVVVSLIQKAG